MKGFREFVLRGNVVDLAIAVVVGAAFMSVVQSLVKDMITPLIAAIGGQPDFSDLYFTINNSRFMYGNFINALISFLIVTIVLYYFVVLPYTTLMSRVRPPAVPTTRECPECLSKIPVAARRCSFCTAEVAPVAPQAAVTRT